MTDGTTTEAAVATADRPRRGIATDANSDYQKKNNERKSLPKKDAYNLCVCVSSTATDSSFLSTPCRAQRRAAGKTTRSPSPTPLSR